MFTQCPDCQTIFELGIDDLKAADGQVCCGECDRVFNAIASLTDVPHGTKEALQAIVDASEHNEPQNGDDAGADEGVSGDLFEQKPDGSQDNDDDAPWEPDDEGLGDDDVASLDRSRWEQKLAELGLDSEEQPVTGDREEEDAAPDGDEDRSETDSNHGDSGEAGANSEIAEWLALSKAPGPNRHWIVAAVVAGIALLAQSVHFWRADLADKPAFGAWLKPIYASAGNPIPETWDVSAYTVAKDTVSDYPEVAGALLVNATVANEADRAQPYPLLKITLLDRWGEPIGERFFAPTEYLENMRDAAELVQPGEKKQATVLIMDPGAGAVSYGIDACLRDNDNRLTCAHGRDY